jgi:hypothetical protein
MTRYLLRALHIVLISALIVGCSRELIVEKRRYRPGWHVALKGAPEKMKKEISSTEVLIADETKSTPIGEETTATIESEELSAEYCVAVGDNESVSTESKDISRRGIREPQPDHSAPAPTADEADLAVKAVKPPSKKPDHFPFLPVMLGSALALGAAFTLRPARVRRMSEWAKNHNEASWAVLTTAHLGLGFGAFYAGHQAGLDGYQASQSWITGSALVFFLSLIFYPFRSMKGLFGGGFIRRKWHDLMLSVTGVLLLFCSATTIPQREAPVNPVSGAIISVLLPDHVYAGETVLQGGTMGHYEPEEYNTGKDGFVKFLATLLAVAVFLLLWALVISLSCNLSCSGQEAAAAFVGIGGTLLLLLLLIMVLRRIWSRKFNRPDKSAQPAPVVPSE